MRINANLNEILHANILHLSFRVFSFFEIVLIFLFLIFLCSLIRLLNFRTLSFEMRCYDGYRNYHQFTYLSFSVCHYWLYVSRRFQSFKT